MDIVGENEECDRVCSGWGSVLPFQFGSAPIGRGILFTRKCHNTPVDNVLGASGVSDRDRLIS